MIHSKKGLFIGRFQPFHLGHLSAVKQALEQVDFLHIGIGSSQYSGTEENPFTAEDREKMIHLTLNKAGILPTQYKIHFIPDIHNPPQWPAHVKKIIPPFDVLFLANHGLVDQLFQEYEPEVKRFQLKRNLDISGTKVRQAIKENGEWEKTVSPAAANYLIQKILN